MGLREVARVLVVVVLAIAAVPLSARAQTGINGSIMGSVFDQTGLPIKGVKITAKSDTQIGGAKVTYSNDEGNFRIIGLLPGTFEVSAAAPKLKTIVQKDIKVGVNAPAEVTLLMEVETQVEEVKVVEKAPIVSTTTANVREVYDEEFVDQLPVEWKTAVEDFVGRNTPGVYYNGIRSIRVRGGGSNQNAFMVEGFYMNNQKVTVGSLAAMEVQTAAYGAENANVAGGVVNMVSKSGSNKYEFDVSGFAEDTNLRYFTDKTDVEAHQWNYFINPAFSGPIIKDRLWFYLNAEARSQVRFFDRDDTLYGTLGNPPARDYLNGRASLKLTWQVSPRNKVSTYSNFNRNWYKNQGTYTRDERDALSMRDDLDYFNGVIWEALLTESMFFRSQVGFQQFWRDEAPERCRSEPLDCDHIPQIRNTSPRELRLQNYEVHQQTVTSSFEVINQLEWFLNNRTLGEHGLKLRSRIFQEIYEQAQSTPGDYYLQFAGTTPDRRRIYYANDPRLEDARYGWRIRGTKGLTTVHSLSDSMRLTRYLTFTPGIGYTTQHAANVGKDADLAGGALTPHVQVAWDATHDGRTVLRASFNNYVDTDAVRLARFALGDRVYQECRYNVATEQFDSECRFGGGAQSRTFGSPCGPTGVDIDGTPCKQTLRIPRTWEYTTGAEREIIQGVGLGADVVYRLYTYPYEDTETNRVWSGSGYALDPAGQYRNGRAETVNDLGTPASARRRYLAITGAIHKREGALKISAAYTWAQLEGNVNNNEGNDFGTNPYRDLFYLYGYLPDDSRHTIKTSMTYQFTKWFSGGFIYRYISGKPYRRRFYNEVDGGFNDYRAQVGVNPGSNINDPGDDRPLRLPDIQEVSMQFRSNLKPLFGVAFEGFVDVINILALRTYTSVEENDGPVWARGINRLDPFRLRLGFRYRY